MERLGFARWCRGGLATLAGLGLAVAVSAETAAQAAPGPSGGAAVGYRVPVESPTGDVQVLLLGAAELPVPSLIGTERFVLVRLAAVNREDDQPWILDARDQVLDLSDERTVAPSYAVPSGGTGEPRITLRRGERGFLDLYFRDGGSDPVWTSLTWRIRRGPGLVMVGRTVFERLLAPEAAYAHYWPSQYSGGELLIGSPWCEPSWSSRWLAPYAPYRRYRYAHHPDGFEVFNGNTRWRYERDTRPVAPGETVGSGWRSEGRDERQWVAPPAPAALHSDPAPERSSWRVKIEPAVRVDRSALSAPSSIGRSWHESQTLEAPSRPSWSHSSSSDSSSGSSSSSSSSSSSQSLPSPSPPASAPSGDSVGSHWHSRH
jgi:hypothetical protein